MNKLKHVCDACSLGGAVSSIMGWLPVTLSVIVSLLAGVWYLLQIYWGIKDRMKKHGD